MRLSELPQKKNIPFVSRWILQEDGRACSFEVEGASFGDHRGRRPTPCDLPLYAFLLESPAEGAT